MVGGAVVVLDALGTEHLAETLALLEDSVRHADGGAPLEDLAVLLSLDNARRVVGVIDEKSPVTDIGRQLRRLAGVGGKIEGS
jgi:hypothetical protein